MSGAGFFSNYLAGRERLYDQIRRRRARLSEVEHGAESFQQHLKAILDDLDELKLVVATLLDVLVTRGVLPQDELRKRAEQIDLLDGRADGMLHGSIEPGGAIMPDEAPQRTALDDLAQAAEQAEFDEDAPSR